MEDENFWHQESRELRSLYPLTSDHPARIKPARWVMFGVGAFCLICGPMVWFNEDIKLVERRQIAGALLGAVGLICAIGSWIAPTKLMSFLCEIFGESNSIDTVLRSDKPNNFKTLALECGVLIAILIPIHLSMSFIFDAGKTIAGIAILIPIAIWSFSIMYRQKFRDSKKFKVLLEPALAEQNYFKAPVANLQSFLADSFLKTDSSFNVDMLYAKSSDPGWSYWGRYSTGGSTLSSGIFCCLRMNHQPTRIEMAEVMGSIGSVCFDDSTETIFGRIKLDRDQKFSKLDAFPWQYCYGALIVRLDEEELKAIFQDAEMIEQNLVRDRVAAWELFVEFLATKADALSL